MKLFNRFILFHVSIFVLCLFLIASSIYPNTIETVSIKADLNDSQIHFAVNDLKVVLEGKGYNVNTEGSGSYTISFEIYEKGMGPQSFRIQKMGSRGIQIFGGDATGLMYGGLELAEMLSFGESLQTVENKARKPYVIRRGLKFNIPFDGRTPSYDDTGDAAQENVATMWDFEFWRHFLNTMARNRYNVLSLWTTNPYPGIVKLPKYPDANFDNVGRLTKPYENIDQRPFGNHFNEYNLFDPANHNIILEISLEDKIKYWTKVFDYAESLGIEIYMFHWNIFLWNAEGKYGITHDQDNLKTIAYQRYCIEQFLKTYPQIDGIGVSAGENIDRKKKWKIGMEDWLFETYGKGMLDVLKEYPDREYRFIFRHLWSDLDKSANAFKGYKVPFNTSHKYARARLYSTTTSPYLDHEYREKVERTNVPCWLNFRNDDLYMLRWGNPEYSREFLHNLPKDLMMNEAGFYMGPDSYVWGKTFNYKNSDLEGQWEIDKHWYRFMIWGRLGYDLSLKQDYFIKRLSKHFSDVDANLLYDTWAASSEIIKWIDLMFFRVNDFQFAPEGCINVHGFLTIEESYFIHPPLMGSGILSVMDYAQTYLEHKPFEGITPFEVADELDKIADSTLEGVKKIRKNKSKDAELISTLMDMEAMAILGQYYANKIRAAANFAVFRKDSTKMGHHAKTVEYLEKSIVSWKKYSKVASSQYTPQILSRTTLLDWDAILKEMKLELKSIASEVK